MMHANIGPSPLPPPPPASSWIHNVSSVMSYLCGELQSSMISAVVILYICPSVSYLHKCTVQAI